ncbi:MAG: hypothetical protein PVG99_07125 [Desulfobacteraceae bacterium]|jgi:hypothetical protein
MMHAPGTKVKMTKGYKGIEGQITQKTNSEFEFYIIALDNGINIVAGPSAFTETEPSEGVNTKSRS